MATKKGRFRGVEWSEFEEVTDYQGLKKQKCIHCSEKISSKVERLREHLKRCKEYGQKNIEVRDFCPDVFKKFGGGTSLQSHASYPVSPPKKALKRSASEMSNLSSDSSNSSCTAMVTPSIDRFAYRTTHAEKQLLDLQLARVFYACNIPFSVAENEHMKTLMNMLRGGTYKPPSRHEMSGHLLNEINEECEAKMASELEGHHVTLIQDGWSNIHNQPIIGSCLHNGKDAYFIRSIDTGSEKKTAEYCSKIAEDEIDYCEKTYKCKVIAFCSDSENKMVLARNILKDRMQQRSDNEEHENTDGRNLIVYGCAAHFVHLIEKEVSPRTVTAQIVEAQK